MELAPQMCIYLNSYHGATTNTTTNATKNVDKIDNMESINTQGKSLALTTYLLLMLKKIIDNIKRKI